MNSFSVLAVALCVFVGYICAQTLNSEGKYVTRLDNANVDEILTNKRLVRQFVHCLLSGKSCSPEGIELSKVLPDALKTNCAKCTDTHIKNILKVYDAAQKDYAEDWKKLVAKWDPTGEYVKAFLQKFAPEKL